VHSANVDAFIQALEGLAATVTTGTPVQILERKVVLLWTSLATNEHACELYVSDTYQPELCSIVNSVLRDDIDAPMLEAAVVFTVVLNKFTNAVRRCAAYTDWSQLPWEEQRTSNTPTNQSWWARHSAATGWVDPTGMLTYRGTAMPAAALAFFKPGTKYRTNMFLATSFR